MNTYLQHTDNGCTMNTTLLPSYATPPFLATLTNVIPQDKDGPTNSSLPHRKLLGVSWQMCHAWNTCEIVSRAVLAKYRLHYTWNYLS